MLLRHSEVDVREEHLPVVGLPDGVARADDDLVGDVRVRGERGAVSSAASGTWFFRRFAHAVSEA